MLTKCFDKQLNRTDVVNKHGKILFIELINELDDNRSFTMYSDRKNGKINNF